MDLLKVGGDCMGCTCRLSSWQPHHPSPGTRGPQRASQRAYGGQHGRRCATQGHGVPGYTPGMA